MTQYEEFLSRRFLSSTSFANFAAAHPGPTGVIAPGGPVFAPNSVGTLDTHHQTAKSWGVFSNFTFDILDNLQLDGGVRWTHVEKDLSSHYTNPNGTAACNFALANLTSILPAPPFPPGTSRLAFAISTSPANPGESTATRVSTFVGTACSTGGDPAFNNVSSTQSKDENQLTGTAKFVWNISDVDMAYLSWARGYKAGGFNFDRERPTIGVFDGDTAFAPEFVRAWELGLKTTWLDGSLLVNAAAFHQRYSNFQLNTFTGLQFVVTPIPEVVSDGVDFDVVWFDPLPGLNLQGGVTYALTQYGHFDPATAPGTNARQPGSRISFGPLWSASLAATYKFDVSSDFDVRLNATGKYTSTYNSGSDLNPTKIQEGYFVANGRISLAPKDGQWELELWALNVLDEDYLQVGFDQPAQSDNTTAFLAAPRTYGVTLRGHF